MKKYILLFLFFSAISLPTLAAQCPVGVDCSWSEACIGDYCCLGNSECEYCVENIDWGYCGGWYKSNGDEFCQPQQPVNCSEVWSPLCCCNGTIALNCTVPGLEHLGDTRLWGDASCNRRNVSIDCDGIAGNHHACSNLYFPPTTGKCAVMEPVMGAYSVSDTSLINGESFSISVYGGCIAGLQGKCLIECRVMKPDGSYIEIDSWDIDGFVALPSVTCNQIGSYIVEYCGVFTDFSKSGGWGKLNYTNTIIDCAPLPQCSNGIDDDNDGKCDKNGCLPTMPNPDPDCSDANDNTECSNAGTSCTQNSNCCGGLSCTGSLCKVTDYVLPTVIINSPVAGSWQKTDFTIYYSATDNIATDKCTLYTKNGASGSWVYRGVVDCVSNRTITVGYGKYCSVEGSNQCSVRIEANDTSGNINRAERNFSVDYTNPAYYLNNDNSGGSVKTGSIVSVYTFWQDNVNLNASELYHNVSGTMKLNSTCSIVSPSGWCNRTINTIGFSGTACWYQWANDTSKNQNNTMPSQCFNVSCDGTDALNCSVPPLEHPGDVRVWESQDCNRTNAKIDCNNVVDGHHVCNVTYPSSAPNSCVPMEPTINKYSVSNSSIKMGQSFYINVSGSCPVGLTGKCLAECRVINPDGNFTELDAWNRDGTITLPSVTCNQEGDYIVDYCLIKTDFNINRGWGEVNGTNTTISCSITPKCSNGIDDDNDGKCDKNGCPPTMPNPDPDCSDANDNTECGNAGASCTQNSNCCGGLSCTGSLCKVIDITPPSYVYDGDNSNGSVITGKTVNAHVLWNDVYELNSSSLVYNITEDWENTKLCSISGTSSWCNKTIDTTGFSGTVCWYQNATDSFNNLNDTMKNNIHCFVVLSSAEASSEETAEDVFESIRRDVSSSSAEFSVNLVSLTFTMLGIIILVILLIIVVQQLVQSHG